jgi:hypothetical protein
LDIVVIGTEPPCIRCLTTHKRALEIARKYPGNIEVKKVAIHTPEAAKYGKVDSGHGIGQAAGLKPDGEKMKRIAGELNELVKDDFKNESLIDAKLKEMDSALQPVKVKAKEMGYLMTPVFIINGEVKSTDYVPSKDEIQAWVEIEMRRSK